MSEQEASSTVNLETGTQLATTDESEKTTTGHPALKGLADLALNRQIGLMLGLALSVAIGVAIVLWSQTPSYDLLYTGIAEQDASEIIDTLNEMNIDYQVDSGSGAIMVPAGKTRELKLKLAARGLPRSTNDSLGYELLDKETGFGTSKNIELMRFQRALEGEIARTIMTLQTVKSARVLLAIPKQSVFVRKRKKPSASVLVSLYPGRILEKQQIEAIVHLVASSVPMLEPGQVTVVDQHGRLLNSKQTGDMLFVNNKQFEYKQQVEEHLMNRIENILGPIVGRDGLRTQVSADVDFTITDKTQEMFNPDLPAIRSEQTQEEQSSQSAVQGVPGALSNQPPPTGVAPEVASGADAQQSSVTPTSIRKSATRNYELDKTITHTRLSTGVVKKLSIAVVVDNKKVPAEDGGFTFRPYSAEDLLQLENLVKQAVGYDASRGDRVTVSNVAFNSLDDLDTLPEQPIWEQPWFADALKQLGAVMVVLFLVFGVLRPVMRGLVARHEDEVLAQELARVREEAEAMGGVVKFDENGKPVAVPVDAIQDEQMALASGAEDLLMLEAPQSYEKRLEYVQKLIDEDPALVAQVLKGWVKDNG